MCEHLKGLIDTISTTSGPDIELVLLEEKSRFHQEARPLRK